MGQTLSEPVTEKETHFDENDFFAFGTSSMQGWRISMEDAHAVELDFAGDRNSAFFGVYDGHGGVRYRNGPHHS
jgi:protein phosphatase 2C family protein 2/3